MVFEIIFLNFRSGKLLDFFFNTSYESDKNKNVLMAVRGFMTSQKQFFQIHSFNVMYHFFVYVDVEEEF